MTTRIQFEPYLERSGPSGGHQRIYKFSNGYGASIIRGPYSYGGDEGFWELAVIKFTEDGETWYLCYDTRITTDVEGYLSEEDIHRLLKRIKRLKRKAT